MVLRGRVLGAIESGLWAAMSVSLGRAKDFVWVEKFVFMEIPT